MLTFSTSGLSSEFITFSHIFSRILQFPLKIRLVRISAEKICLASQIFKKKEIRQRGQVCRSMRGSVLTITYKGRSVLFFSRPRSEGWPHHGRTFSIYPCPLSFWLTLPRTVLSTSWCCLSRPCVAFLAYVHLACSLHYLFLQATPWFPHGVTIVC